MASKIREKYLSNMKPVQKKLVDLKIGDESYPIEFREPSAALFLTMNQEKDKVEQTWIYIVNNCYEAGTNNLVFEEADKDTVFSSGAFDKTSLLSLAGEAMTSFLKNTGEK